MRRAVGAPGPARPRRSLHEMPRRPAGLHELRALRSPRRPAMPRTPRRTRPRKRGGELLRILRVRHARLERKGRNQFPGKRRARAVEKIVRGLTRRRFARQYGAFGTIDMIYWFTGQPGAGKTTLAQALVKALK